MSRLKVIIADDHPLFLNGLTEFLSLVGDIHVAQTCKNGTEALASIRNHRPDVAILDFAMPEMTGLEVLLATKSSVPEARVLFLTGASSHQEIQTAMNSGAYGVLTKDSDPQRLLYVICNAARGEKTYPFELLQAPHQHHPSASSMRARLSEKERRVIFYAAEGLSNKEIARELNITEGTTKVHLYRIFRKTGAKNRTALAKLSLQSSSNRD